MIWGYYPVRYLGNGGEGYNILYTLIHDLFLLYKAFRRSCWAVVFGTTKSNTSRMAACCLNTCLFKDLKAREVCESDRWQWHFISKHGETWFESCRFLNRRSVSRKETNSISLDQFEWFWSKHLNNMFNSAWFIRSITALDWAWRDVIPFLEISSNDAKIGNRSFNPGLYVC